MKYITCTVSYIVSMYILSSSICLVSQAKQRSYSGDSILRVTVENENDWKTVQTIMSQNTIEDDIWAEPTQLPSWTDVRVSQKEYSTVTSQFREHGLHYKIFMDDVQKFIELENLLDSKNPSKPFRRKRASMQNNIIGNYATFDEIRSYMMDAAKYFDIASTHYIGDSTEGRPLLVLKLGIPHPDPNVVKPVIWIDAGIHAREWIAPASLMYIVYQLLNGYYEKEPVIFDLLKRIDWWFLPVVNPDGYVYTHTKERLWRKNRANNTGSSCRGVDLNRNFEFHWGEETASDDPCHVMYRGRSPASEVETQVVQRFLYEHRAAMMVYISLHSYSQFWFTRWAYTSKEAENHEEMYGLAKRATEALVKVHGADYKAGRPFELLYGYSGGSADWAHGVAGIPYTYTIELRDKGQFGFLLPANYVIPVGQELYAGVLVVADHVKNISDVDFSFLEAYHINDIQPDNVNHQFDFVDETTAPTPLVNDQTTSAQILDSIGQGITTVIDSIRTTLSTPIYTKNIFSTEEGMEEDTDIPLLDKTYNSDSDSAGTTSQDVPSYELKNVAHPPSGVFQNSSAQTKPSSISIIVPLLHITSAICIIYNSLSASYL